MKVAITDACIFMDLLDLQLTAPFFELTVEAHTSIDVFNELYPHYQDIFKTFQLSGKLILHNLKEEDRILIRQMNLPNGLSPNDKSVLYLATKHDVIILSSDSVVRNNSKARKIEYHGMLWIFDQLLERSLMSHQDACIKLKRLIITNTIYRNNMILNSEMNNRIKNWQKHI